MKRGPCQIVRKFDVNAYELELPKGLGISPISNVANLYPYQVDDEDAIAASGSSRKVSEIFWRKQMPMAEDLEYERVLDTRVAKHTRGKENL